MRFRSFVWLGTRSRAGRIWPGIYNRRNKFINRLKVCVCLQIYTQKSQPHQDSSVYVVKERCNAVIFAINSIFMRCLHMHRYNIQRIFSPLSLSVSSALSLALSLSEANNNKLLSVNFNFCLFFTFSLIFSLCVY